MLAVGIKHTNEHKDTQTQTQTYTHTHTHFCRSYRATARAALFRGGAGQSDRSNETGRGGAAANLWIVWRSLMWRGRRVEAAGGSLGRRHEAGGGALRRGRQPEAEVEAVPGKAAGRARRQCKSRSLGGAMELDQGGGS